MSRALAALVGVVVLLPVPARADTPEACTGIVDTVPFVIDAPGLWCVDRPLHLDTAVADLAIEIRASNVTLDCDGFVVGTVAGTPRTATGIGGSGVGAVVRDCHVRQFDVGIALDNDAGRYIVEHNTVRANRSAGISVAGDSSLVRDNHVLLPASPWPSTGIATSGTVDVRDNVVELPIGDYDGPGPAPTQRALRIDGNRGGAIRGNRIFSRGTGHYATLVGALVTDSPGATVRENVVTGMSVGIQCNSVQIAAAANVGVRNVAFLAGCRDAGNVVVP